MSVFELEFGLEDDLLRCDGEGVYKNRVCEVGERVLHVDELNLEGRGGRLEGDDELAEEEVARAASQAGDSTDKFILAGDLGRESDFDLNVLGGEGGSDVELKGGRQALDGGVREGVLD